MNVMTIDHVPRRQLFRLQSAIAILSACVIGCTRLSGPLFGEDAAREVRTVDVKELKEISGLAASRQNPGVVWVHDDGDIKSVYAVQTSGDLVVQLTLGKAATDCEDMAIGPGPGGDDYLYLGDIGDNDEDRDTIRVLRLAEPVLSDDSPARVAAEGVETLSLVYPDGPHDAESLLVDPHSGDVLIVTKDKRSATLYRAPAASWTDDSPVALQRMASIPVESVSAGDVSRDGRWILLRREETGWLFERRTGEPLADALGREPKTVPVRGGTQKKNGEAVAFHPDGSGYYTISEGKRQPVCFFELP
jgi:hypothetical protein